MASRIYYTDPYCFEFDATVTHVVSAPADAAGGTGARWLVRLDRTAFYPTTGGQPFDMGTLGGVNVVDVLDVDVEEGGTGGGSEVEHVTDAPLTVGQAVHGAVDRARRLDHMQQHTGQHILSAAFEHLWKVRTESFHLGSGGSSTIDLGREVRQAEIAAAEDEANRVVWENRPVAIRFVSAEEAATLPLRKEPKRGGELRVIDVENFDLSACGGTHVARTGEVGLIAVRGWERFKGGTRVEFVCGGRALRSFRELREVVNGSVRLLSVLPSELPAAIERAQSESKELRRQLREQQQKLAVHEAAALAASAEPIGPLSAVVAAIEDADAATLKTLATSIVANPGHVAALVSTTTPALVVIARSPDASLDAAALLKQLIARYGGKGGGRPDIAQGGGLTGAPMDIVSVLRELIAKA